MATFLAIGIDTLETSFTTSGDIRFFALVVLCGSVVAIERKQLVATAAGTKDQWLCGSSAKLETTSAVQNGIAVVAVNP